MKPSSIRESIFEGDKVIDHLDDYAEREIQRFETHSDGSVSVYMTDGGVMGLAEIKFNDFENLNSQSMAPFMSFDRFA